jgi:hypothetical protein
VEEVQLDLYLNGRRVDKSRVVPFFDTDSVEIPFTLRDLRKGANSGSVRIAATDKMVRDNTYHFVVKTETRLPVLVLEGTSQAAQFLVPALTLSAPFETDVRRYTQLPPDEDLSGYAGVFLVEVPRLDPLVVESLREYVATGGLLVHFPGTNTELNPWNSSQLLPVELQSVVQAGEDERPRPASGVTEAERVGEGLSVVLIRRVMQMRPNPDARVLANTTEGRPFLVSGRIGQGSVYTFAVSARDGFSNLPKRFPFIVLVRRLLSRHLAQVGQPLSYPALTPLRLHLPPGITEVIGPDGNRHKLPPAEDLRKPRTFPHTGSAGIYRVDAPALENVEGDAAEEPTPGEGTTAIAAVNVPADEHTLEKLDETSLGNIERVLGQSVYVARTGDSGARTSGPADSARATFPLAVLAMLMVGAATVMAWYMDRPADRPETEEEAA